MRPPLPAADAAMLAELQHGLEQVDGLISGLNDTLQEHRQELQATREILCLLLRQLGGGVQISALTQSRYAGRGGQLEVTRDQETGILWLKVCDVGPAASAQPLHP